MTQENGNHNPLSAKTISRIAVGTIVIAGGISLALVIGLVAVAVHFIGKFW